MTWLLIIGTILGGIGGIAGAWYLFDKLTGRDRPPQEVRYQRVTIRYPEESGLQARLQAEGYELRWARPERAPSLIDGQGFDAHESPIRGGTVFGSHDMKSRAHPKGVAQGDVPS